MFVLFSDFKSRTNIPSKIPKQTLKPPGQTRPSRLSIATSSSSKALTGNGSIHQLFDLCPKNQICLPLITLIAGSNHSLLRFL